MGWSLGAHAQLPGTWWRNHLWKPTHGTALLWERWSFVMRSIPLSSAAVKSAPRPPAPPREEKTLDTLGTPWLYFAVRERPVLAVVSPNREGDVASYLR